MFRLENENNVDFLMQKRDRGGTGLQNPEDGREDSMEEQRHVSKSVMDKVEKQDEIVNASDKIRLKIRFDYRGTARPARFFFGKKSTEEVAEELREQKMSLWQNIPLQGINVEDIKVFEIYTVVEEDENTEEEVAYAPIEIIVTADSLEDCVYLVSREEFRRVEVLEPESVNLNSREIEKLFIKISQLFQRVFEEYR